MRGALPIWVAIGVVLLVAPCPADEFRYVTVKEGAKAALYDRPSTGAKQVAMAHDGCRLTVKKSLIVGASEWLYVSWERSPRGTVGVTNAKFTAAYINAAVTDPAVPPK